MFLTESRDLEYRRTIQRLEGELALMKEKNELAMEKYKAAKDAEIVETRVSWEKKIAEAEAGRKAAEAIRENSPYAQLTDILKALVVKLPTMDIREISVSGKEK